MFREVLLFGEVAKLGKVAVPKQLDGSGRAVTLFADDDFADIGGGADTLLPFLHSVLEVFGAPAGRVDPMLFGNTALAMMMVRKAIPEQMPFLFPEAADAMVRFQIDALVAALEAARGEDPPRKETPHDTDA